MPLEILKTRALALAKARAFFYERSVLEVDCPQLTSAASIDAHIDLIEALNGEERRYLHTSPEYAMKRLIVGGAGDIYQLGHVFRAKEFGRKHNPEFTMAEWYRLSVPFQFIIDETLDFCRLFLGSIPAVQLTYREAFLRYCALDPYLLSHRELLDYIRQHAIPAYEGLEDEGKDAALNLILGTMIEPRLGEDCLFVLSHYPATQAALARRVDLSAHEHAAERFEVYYKGVELANGYHELADAAEQRARFEESNQARLALGKQALPLDEYFLAALKKGMPDCCGVAVGFDRLLMLQEGASSLETILPFPWDSI